LGTRHAYHDGRDRPPWAGGTALAGSAGQKQGFGPKQTNARSPMLQPHGPQRFVEVTAPVLTVARSTRSSRYRTIGRSCAMVRLSSGKSPPPRSPQGWHDEQRRSLPAHHDDDSSFFAWAVGPESRSRSSTRRAPGLRTSSTGDVVSSSSNKRAPRLRSSGRGPASLPRCECSDRVFAGGEIPDPCYGSTRGLVCRRRRVVDAGATCFCTSMGTGPGVETGTTWH